MAAGSCYQGTTSLKMGKGSSESLEKALTASGGSSEGLNYEGKFQSVPSKHSKIEADPQNEKGHELSGT